MLFQLDNIKKEFQKQVIFDGASFVLREKQKIAVIGRNGAGKSTLFNLIRGTESIDEGRVYLHPNCRLGYLAQHDPFTGEEITLEFLMASTGEPEWKCAKMLARFGIKNEQVFQQIKAFSGGYQMRIKLAHMLLFEPNVLLLDEPTNYLDLSTQLLLEKFLENYNGSFLLISHDREFLKRTCVETLHIEKGKLEHFPGGVEEFFAYKKQLLDWQKRYNKKQEKQRQHLQEFVDRFRAKASKASAAQSKMKQIKKLKNIEISEALRNVQIQIPNIESRKGLGLRLSNLTIGYGDKKIAEEINFDINKGEHIAIVGDNGQGKSTFMKTLVGEIDPIEGSFRWGKDLKIAYYAQHLRDMLNPQENIEEYLMRHAHKDVFGEDILRIASNFLFSGDDLKKNISVLSGGEKSRLCLAALFLQKKDVLLLDEPTNHLDFETVEALATAIEKTNMTVIFISHNRTFVSLLADGIIEVKNGKVKRFLHDYDNYVYHLREEVEKELTIDHPVETPGTASQSVNIKESKRMAREIEEEIGKWERRKERLLAWFERNYHKHNIKKQEELKLIEEKLAELEEKWMKLL